MSCPDWSALAARRDADVAGEAAWDDALVHFDGCAQCRDQAFAAEPTLHFRSLPRIAASDADVAGMRQAVAALRQAHELELRERSRAMPVWRLAAMLAVLLGAALLHGTPPSPSPFSQASRPVVVAEPALDLTHIPLVEIEDVSSGTLVQLDDDEVSIVMVLAAADPLDV